MKLIDLLLSYVEKGLKSGEKAWLIAIILLAGLHYTASANQQMTSKVIKAIPAYNGTVITFVSLYLLNMILGLILFLFFVGVLKYVLLCFNLDESGKSDFLQLINRCSNTLITLVMISIPLEYFFIIVMYYEKSISYIWSQVIGTYLLKLKSPGIAFIIAYGIYQFVDHKKKNRNQY